jgi:putative hydrolase of the HAD superfamily
MARYDAVLFDLGNTLVSYYELPDFPAILSAGIEATASSLVAHGILLPSSDQLTERVQAENHEAADYCVRPLEQRLGRIFGLGDIEAAVAAAMCHAFMGPIFAIAKLYNDTLPTLHELRSRGIRTAIVSNSPWGSPASLWQDELARHGILPLVDAAIFCGDVGWRKPDARIFHHTTQQLGVTADRCLFVGDDPRWDIVGPRGVGMEAVLIDRVGVADGSIKSLDELVELVGGQRLEAEEPLSS